MQNFYRKNADRCSLLADIFPNAGGQNKKPDKT